MARIYLDDEGVPRIGVASVGDTSLAWVPLTVDLLLREEDAPLSVEDFILSMENAIREGRLVLPEMEALRAYKGWLDKGLKANWNEPKLRSQFECALTWLQFAKSQLAEGRPAKTPIIPPEVWRRKPEVDTMDYMEAVRAMCGEVTKREED